MKLSIVTPLYLSAPYIHDFYRRIREQAEQITDDYEIVFINDGSPDNSLEIAVGLREYDRRVKVVDLSRNYGHHKAVMTGLAFTTGDLVFFIDVDLELDPELLAVFYRRFQEEKDCDVIYGVQKSRKGSFFRRVTGAVFYRLINFLSGLDMPKNVVAAELMSRRHVESMLKCPEKETYFQGISFLVGFRQVPLEVEKRVNNRSTYSLRRKIQITFNSIISFSDKPLTLIFAFGTAITIVAALAIIYVLAAWVFLEQVLPGWTSVMLSVWFLGGLVIFFLGIIGLYLGKVFNETKDRPRTIVRHFYDGD